MEKYVDVKDEEIRTRIKQRVDEYLDGAWIEVDQNDIIIKRITYGHANEIYLCELPSNEKYAKEEHKKVVIRIMEQIVDKFHGDFTSMTINFLVAGEAQLGPKVYGVFKGGIITEFLEGRNYEQNDDFNDEIVEELAKVLAKFHSLEIPASKDTSKKWPENLTSENGQKYFDMMITEIDSEKVKKNIQEVILQGKSMREEAKWLGSGLKSVKSQLVTAHMDFNRGNILIKDDPFEIRLIDLDFSGYNYRGTDFGRYFSTWRQKEMLFGFDRFPSDEEMSLFLKAYIKENVNLHGEGYLKKEINTVASMIKETKYFTLIAYFVDTLFLIFKCKSSQDDKQGFVEMGKTRFNGYLKLKEQFLKEKSLPEVMMV